MIPNIFALAGAAALLLYWLELYQQFPANCLIELDAKVIFFALVGGILPALLWLWFWLKEDAKKPEPNSLILLAFLGGMVAVPLTIPFEQAAVALTNNEFSVIFLWALTEELIKYIIICVVALNSRFCDEPIDALIYLITGALGFAALENSLYLMNSIVDGGIFVGAMNTHLRFLGASLLHLVSSSAVGIALAFSFYKKKRQMPYLILGIIAATILHTVFNLFIIETQNILETLTVFSYYWFIVIILIFIFERIKLLKKAVPTPIKILPN